VGQEQDNIYINKVLNGDRNAYAYLVDKYKTMVFSLAYNITKNRDEAEEVAQETFIKAYQSLRNYQGKAKFSSWLYRIVYNAAISNIRKYEKGKITIDEANVPESLYVESKKNHELLSAEERKRFLEMALNSLEEDERALVIMYYYEDRELEDIAGIAGLTKTNTKVKLFRARKKMLTVLNSYLKEEKYSLL
jgi:RNA polymerase sigma-70 factor (ECF subfamily)